MADQVTDAPTQQSDLAEVLAQRDAQLAAANERLGRMEETLNALRPPPPGPAPTHTAQGKPIIPTHLRQRIASEGLTDAEIEANGALILPFLNAYLGQAAGEVLSMIQQQADEITMLKMLRDVERYPHAEDVLRDMVAIREAEGKAGRYVDPDTAYKVAVANNIGRIAGQGGGESEGQFTHRQQGPTAAPTSPATIRSRDLSAGSSLRSVRASATQPERPTRTADDLQSMSREERRAFFEANGTTPVRSVG